MNPLVNPVGALITDLLFKGTLFVLFGFAGALCLRRSAAASRYLLWSLVFAGLLLLPLFRMVFPACSIDLLPTASIQKPSGALTSTQGGQSAVETNLELPTLQTEPHLQSLAAGVSTQSSTPLPEDPAAKLSPILTLTIVFWICGCLISLGIFLAGLFQLRVLRRKCKPANDERLLRFGAEVSARLGIKRKILLLQAPSDSAFSAPMTWGSIHPIVLIPEALINWPDEMLRAALLHEYAHIRRGDWLIQLLSRTVCSLNWFHPGVWWAAGRLRQEGEQSCDDIVLLAGVVPSTYAGALMEVISMRKSLRSTLSLAMSIAQPSIEVRIRAILMPARPRILSRAAFAGSILCAGIVLLPLSALQVRAALPKLAPLTTDVVPPAPKKHDNAGISYKTVLTKAESVSALKKRLHQSELENRKLRKRFSSLEQRNQAVSPAQEKQMRLIQVQIARLEKLLAEREMALNNSTHTATPNQRISPFSAEDRALLTAQIKALEDAQVHLEALANHASKEYKAGLKPLSHVRNAILKRDKNALQLAAIRKELIILESKKQDSATSREQRTLELSLAQIQLQRAALAQETQDLQRKVNAGVATTSELEEQKSYLAGLDAQSAELKQQIEVLKNTK